MYSPAEFALKRALDVSASLVGLAVAAPVLAVSAALVRLSSPGPVLFRQTRVGRCGRPFVLLKFRTMKVASSGPEITADGDRRITRVGRILRKSKLDELPELFNVLRGDMSLVGPRPEVPKYVQMYPPETRAILQQVRPGLTDPATIRFRNEEDILAAASDPEATYVTEILPEKLRMYRDYLDSASLGRDVLVLARTLRVIIKPKAAPH